MLRKLPPPRRLRTADELDDMVNSLPDTPSGARIGSGDEAVVKRFGQNTYRYLLWRVWEHRKPRLIWVMLNPSTADAALNDPTIRRVIHFTKREGCGGFYVINLNSFRATKPEVLKHMDRYELTGPNHYHQMNECVMSAAKNNWKIVVGWGAHEIAKRNQTFLHGQCAIFGLDLHCLGTTKDGNPRHPLYVKGNQPLIRWRKLTL